MKEKFYHVDAFTEKFNEGNPAAVCLLEKPMDDAWMQAIAAEMNLSETAFLVKEGDSFSLRWFTPKVEVELCGHATLASAHVLFETGIVPKPATILFNTQSGLLQARWKDGWVELDFPSQPPVNEKLPDAVFAALGILPAVALRNGNKVLIEVQDETIVRDLKPDFVKLLQATSYEIIITSRSSFSEFDFVSRFFAPVVGINEDPVTGSAHCLLTPYWSRKLGKSEMKAHQVSSRGGILRVRLEGDRVFLLGQAVTVASGCILV